MWYGVVVIFVLLLVSVVCIIGSLCVLVLIVLRLLFIVSSMLEVLMKWLFNFFFNVLMY